MTQSRIRMPSHTALHSYGQSSYREGVNHEVVTFSNGTRSLKQLSTGQVMHSAVGPETEAETLYFSPSKRILTREGRKTVWDVGMGTGVNVLTVIKNLDPKHLNRTEFVSFENDLDGLKTALDQSLPAIQGYEMMLSSLLNDRTFEEPKIGFKWHLLEGDFRSVMRSTRTLSPADVVYFDFYSPKACPELWSTELFSDLKRHCNQEVLFLTYSSSTAVRRSLLSAGFFVGQGAKTEMKTETTQASLTLSQLDRPLSREWLLRKDFAIEFQNHAQFKDSSMI